LVDDALIGAVFSQYGPVKCVHCDETEEIYVEIFLPYERSFSLVFRKEKWLVGQSLLPEILGQRAAFGAKSPILPISPITRSASAVRPSEKKIQLTLIGSPLRAFQRALDDHRTLPLSPPKGLNNEKQPISVQNRTSLEESLLQTFFVSKLSVTML